MSSLSLLEILDLPNLSVELTPEMRKGLVESTTKILSVLTIMTEKVQGIRVSVGGWKEIAQSVCDLPPELQSLLYHVINTVLSMESDIPSTSCVKKPHDIAVTNATNMRDILYIAQWLSTLRC